jgi:amidase
MLKWNFDTSPMSPTLDGLDLFARAVVSASPWLLDPKCINIPWRPVDLPAKLGFGVVYNDGMASRTMFHVHKINCS